MSVEREDSKRNIKALKTRCIALLLCVMFIAMPLAACAGNQVPASTDTNTSSGAGKPQDEIKQSIREAKDELIESFSVEETWKRIGIERYCDDAYQLPELSTLTNRISENDGDIMSLFPAYFNEKFASSEQIETATAVAASLTEYLLDKYGLDFYVELSETEPYINEWLDASDIDFDYDDKFAEQLSKVTIDDHLYYDYVVYTERNERLYCKPTQWIKTPFDVRRYIHEYLEGTETILAGLQKDAPETYEFIVDNMPNVLEIFFDDGNNGSNQSGGYARRTQIHLGVEEHPYIVFHELMHIWLYWMSDMEIWQSEGLAEYIPLRYYQSPSIKESVSQVVNQYTHEICLLYKEHGYPLQPDTADYYLYQKCVAEYEYRHRNDEDFEIQTLADVAGIPKNEWSEGCELSYKQAMILVSYLIENTNLDTFVKNSGEGVSLVEAYGMEYEELKNECRRAAFDTD